MRSKNRSIVQMCVLSAVVMLLVFQARQSAADEDLASRIKQLPVAVGEMKVSLDSAEAETRVEKLPALPRTPMRVVQPTSMMPQAVEDMEASCYQLMANPQLDIVEFGDDTGSAEPWVVLYSSIYYDENEYVSPFYSLVTWDGDDFDEGDEDIDAFGQGFFMPEKLESVFIEYGTAVSDADDFDEVYGAIWTLDQDGFLDEVVSAWLVGQPAVELDWSARFYEVTDAAELAQMEGAVLAMTFFAYGDQLLPFQFTFFDDVNVIACVEEEIVNTLYLPSVVTQVGVAVDPVCTPPNETPQDQYNANRGIAQPNATCESNLSSIDRADYYSFRPAKSGAHTLQLRDLPSGTEWSAMIFLDQPDPDYAPGPTGGQCRIGTPGSSNKQVTCQLDKNKMYFVKVSAGGSYSGPVGDYLMRVVAP